MRRQSSLLHVLVVALLLGLLAGCSGARGHKGAAVKLDPAKVPTPYHTLVDIEFVKPLVFEAMLNQNPSTKAIHKINQFVKIIDFSNRFKGAGEIRILKWSG